MWQDPLAPQKEISFFQYNTKLARHLLLDKKRSSISAYRFWKDQGIEEQDISIFWKMFWEVEIARKISMFHWLVMHRAVPVKQCLKIPLLNTLCLECKLMEESIRHCLWDCCHAKLTWLRILRILQINGLNMNVSWGSVVWMSLKENAFAYGSRLGVTDAISISRRTICRVYLHQMVENLQDNMRLEMWKLISNCTIWHIWKARCLRLFTRSCIPAAETIKEIWREIVVTLKARFDAIEGESDAAVRRRSTFHTVWNGKGFYHIQHSNVRWRFATPVWLFPPP